MTITIPPTTATAPPVPAAWPELTPPPRSGPGSWVAARLFRSAVGRLDVTVRLRHDGREEVLGRGGPAIVVDRPAELFARLGRDQLIGLGEAYLTGAWAEDGRPGDGVLGDFLTVLAAETADLVPRPLQRLRSLIVRRVPHSHRGSRSDTAGNIAHHYDLSNDLFATFLDPTLSYSSALFADPADATAGDLEAAQHRKVERLLDQATVGPGTRLLEIGTGWGELAIRAAARGATVRTVTLSSEQRDLARRRVAAAGCGGRVTVELCDYRALLDDPSARGAYDAVLSVEMLEAVGWRYWPTYVRVLDHVLAPGGKVALQTITLPHHRMLETRDTHTFITKYVFPGGSLPSVRAIEDALDSHTSLRVVDDLAIGAHYARTLRLWDEAFVAASDRIRGLGFDEVFLRLWHFYLEYSRAGFASGYLDDHQLTLAREA